MTIPELLTILRTECPQGFWRFCFVLGNETPNSLPMDDHIMDVSLKGMSQQMKGSPIEIIEGPLRGTLRRENIHLSIQPVNNNVDKPVAYVGYLSLMNERRNTNKTVQLKTEVFPDYETAFKETVIAGFVWHEQLLKKIPHA